MNGDKIQEKISSRSKIDPVDVYVGRQLKNRRIMLGLSQQDLGDVVNVSIQQIQKYEKATNRVSSSKLFYFAKLLQVPITYFFDKLLENNSAEDPAKINSIALAEHQSNFTNEDEIPEREVVNLIRAFSDIKQPHLRKKIIELIRGMNE